jgi:hypothetical protein
MCDRAENAYGFCLVMHILSPLFNAGPPTLNANKKSEDTAEAEQLQLQMLPITWLSKLLSVSMILL